MWHDPKAMGIRAAATLRGFARSITAIVAALGTGCGGEVTQSSPSATGGVATVSTPGGNATGGNAPVGTGGADAGDPFAPPAVDLVPVDGLTIDADAGCDGIQPVWDAIPVALQIVMDTSSSMSLPASGSTDTRWNVTRDALLAALGSIPSMNYVGVQFFPNMQTGFFGVPQAMHTACVNPAGDVKLGVLGQWGSNQRNALDSALLAVEIVAGEGTPTLDAYDLGVSSALDGHLPPDRYVLLLTGGNPTYAEWCVGDVLPTVNSGFTTLTDAIVSAISAEFAAGIKTLVVGAPGSESGGNTGIDARPWLSMAARAGGTATDGCSDTGVPYFCHLDLSSSVDARYDLARLFESSFAAQAPCIYWLYAPFDPALVHVIYTAASGQRYAIAFNPASPCDLGWHFADSSRTAIEICGKTCDRIRTDRFAAIEIILGCTLPVPFP
jgi:hypothetical protein